MAVRNRRMPGCTALMVVITMALTVARPMPTAAKTTVEKSGTAITAALPILAGALSLSIGDTEGFLRLGLSSTTSLGIALGLKQIIHSERPNGRNNKSFPSGHAVVAFSSASYLDHRYGWKFGLPSYLLATYVAWTRVNSKQHHIRDVAAGALMSWGISHVFVVPYRGVALGGVYTGDKALLRLHIRW